MLRVSQYSRVDHADRCSIIAIPGYCAIPFDKWDVQEVQNAAASVNSVSRLFFYTYNQPYLPKGAFSWEEYLESAQDLLVSVARLVSEVSQLLRFHKRQPNSDLRRNRTHRDQP